MIRIISGGQTGADQAALDAAIALHLPHGGWLPKGRKTENGPLPLKYNLRELDSSRYRDRTEQNVLDSDGTLICSHGPLTGGSALTEALTIRHGRPFLHIDFDQYSLKSAADAVQGWLLTHGITTLNVAGSRASGDSHIYQAVHDLLMAVDWSLSVRPTLHHTDPPKAQPLEPATPRDALRPDPPKGKQGTTNVPGKGSDRPN